MRTLPSFVAAGIMIVLAVSTTLASSFETPVHVANVNSAKQDKSPTISCDGLELLFHSNRNEGAISLEHDIFLAVRQDESTAFGMPVPVLLDAFTPDISADGLTLYFTKNTGSAENLDADLFYATRPDRQSPFSAPVALAELNSIAKEASPTISCDGLTIVFHSDRPGGAGATDLWIATRSNSSQAFGMPVNLAELNTAAQEYTPSLSHDSLRLYFASDRSGGAGEEDIWVAERASVLDPFGGPVPVAAINTAGIDKACDIACDGRSLYLRSPREGGLGQSDIWVAVDARSGNVDLGASGAPADVLTIGASAGGGDRIVRLAPGDPISIELAVSPSGPAFADYALYAFAGATDETTVAVAPFGIGAMVFATPLRAGTPQPIVVANTFAHPRAHRLGIGRRTLPRAPGVLVQVPNGWPTTAVFTLQAILADDGARSPYRVSGTNAVELRIE